MRSDLPADFGEPTAYFADLRMREVRPMPGAVALLDHLKARGIACAMATSATRASSKHVVDPTGLLDCDDRRGELSPA